MRPLTLELEGFTAYKEPSRVDFEGLQLVVLTGLNGSGKSSLLEAMIFALFGVTPRMKGKQSKEFISHGRDQFRIGFVFQVEGNTYRVQRRYFRKGTPAVRLEMKQETGWKTIADKVEETNRAVTSLLHMGYDTFTKAVVLPQNLFDQFLKGDKEKRREVLEEILSLELFEKVSALAGEKSRALRERIRLHESTVEEKSRVASDDNINAAAEQLARLVEEIGTLASRRASLEEERRELVQLSEWTADLLTLDKRRSALIADKAAWEKRETELVRLRKLLPLLPKLARYAEQSGQLARLREQASALCTEIDSLSENARAVEEQMRILDKKESDRIPFLKTELETLLGLQETAAILDRQKAEERNKKTSLFRLEKEISGAESALRNLAAEMAKWSETLSSTTASRKALEKLEERFHLYSDSLESLGRLKDLTNKINEGKDKLRNAEGEMSQMTQKLDSVRAARESLSGRIAAEENENEVLRTAWLVYELQGKLADGKKCPVCAQDVHALPHPSPPERPLKELTEARLQFESILKEESRLQEVEARLKFDMEKERREIDGLTSERKEIEERLCSVLALPSGDLLTAARLEYKRLQDNQKELKEIRAREESALREFQEAEKAHEKKVGALSLQIGEKTHLETALVSLAEAIAEGEERMKSAGVAGCSIQEIRSKITSHQNEVARFAKEKEEVSNAFHAMRARFEQASSQAVALAGEEEERRVIVQTLKEEIEAALPPLGFKEIESVPKIDTEEIFRMEKEIADYRFELKGVEEKIGELHSKLGDRAAEPGDLERLDAELGAAGGRLSSLQTEKGKTERHLEEMQKAKEEVKGLAEQLEGIRKQESIYATLQQDLQKNRLPDFLLSSVLNAILESAGEKFSDLSQGRYRLALEGIGEIQVLDAWNANESRPASSLSGGESFAASLAVALALSDYLQGRQKVQALFIDEGFGNLDRETRDKVAEVLSALQTEEKLIGIVTHIEELAELFPDRIVIEKLPEGSKVVQTKMESTFDADSPGNDLLIAATGN